MKAASIRNLNWQNLNWFDSIGSHPYTHALSNAQFVQQGFHKDMPNHRSAEKRDRQNANRNAINTTNRTRLRTSIKKLRVVIDTGDSQEAQALLPETISAIDRSVQKGVLHRNAAARHKARLTGHVNALATK